MVGLQQLTTAGQPVITLPLQDLFTLFISFYCVNNNLWFPTTDGTKMNLPWSSRKILNSRFMSFVVGRLQNLFSGIIERQGNPALTSALTGVGLGVATAGATFLGKN